MKNNYYATNYRAGDAFLAGHLGEWVQGNKNKLTKTQLAHIVTVLETYSLEIYEDKQDVDKMVRHLNMMFDNINNED